MNTRHARTVWKVTSTSLALLVATLSGCDIGSREKFVASSTKGVELASHHGSLLIVPGNALLDYGRTMGPQKNLLYLLVVCPGLAANGHGNGAEYGQRSNTYIWRWETQQGEVSVSVRWNKRDDRVSVGKQQFKRDEGNTFVIVRQSSGKLVTTQLSSPGPQADPQTVLDFIQNQMTNNALVRSVRLPERD